MLKPQVVISACLLGEYCRYDGQIKEFFGLREAFSAYEIIPFCPEAPLFSTPRQRISVVLVEGKHRIITDETKEDVTQKLEDAVHLFAKKYVHATTFVLKSKSPSCGLATTPILNEKNETVCLGDGLAAKIFKTKFMHAKIYDEHSIGRKLRNELEPL